MRHSFVIAAALAAAGTAPAAGLELVQTIQLKGKPGTLDHLALDTKRDRLLVANKANNTLDVVDLKTGTLVQQVPNQTGVQGIAFAPEVDRIYVGLGTNGLCNVFDANTLKAVKTVKFADDCDNVRYNPRTQLVYVAHAEQSLGVISARTNGLKADIKLPAAAEAFVLETGRPRAYIAAPSPCQVIVVDTAKNAVATSYPVKAAGGAHPIALDEAAHRLYLGCRKEPKVVVLDTESGKELGEAAIPGDVDDLFLDGKRKRLYRMRSAGEAALRAAETGLARMARLARARS